jgi:hypothetical protein
MASGMVHTRAVSEIQHREYSTAAILCVATLAALPATGFYFMLSYFWRFPVPFYPAFALWPFTASLILAHAIVFHGGRLHTEVRTKLVLYVPSLLLQLSQLTIYPAISPFSQSPTNGSKSCSSCSFPVTQRASAQALSRRRPRKLMILRRGHSRGHTAIDPATTGNCQDPLGYKRQLEVA